MFVRLGRFRIRFKQAMLRFRSIRNWKCYNCSGVDIYVIQNCVICVFIYSQSGTDYRILEGKVCVVCLFIVDV